MDKVTDKIAALPAGATYVSLEFFPPKTAMGFSNLRDRLDRMQRALHPLFVNVTWGAGGSTAQKSLELAEICQRELGLTTCLHLTCTNMSRRMIDKALDDAKALGIRNILALRGDAPRRAEYRIDGDSDAEEEFAWAVDLVKYIRKWHGDYFCIGVAAYPEGHSDESHPADQSVEHDLPYLVDKVKAGADFIMTQLFFDASAYERFEKTLREHPSGVFESIPIIPGLMPIQSYQMIRRTTKLSHASVPPAVIERLNTAKGDDEKVKMVGVDIVSELVEKIKEIKGRTQRPMGFHFYTLNLEKAVSHIIERTKLTPEESDEEEEMDTLPIPRLAVNGDSTGGKRSHRRQSFASDMRNRVIVSGDTASDPVYETTAMDAGIPEEPINTRANTLAISEGEGVLGREATWDDFPNGRWGDARSPAYGEIDGYGVSLHMAPAEAVRLWQYPATSQDISNLFIKHIKGELRALPWSEEELSAESSTIQQQLLRLNSKGWWTVASQPAINGMRSSDSTFGWGPANGFVFQKAFVEFFLPGSEWKQLFAQLTSPETSDHVSFYAINAAGEFASSDYSGGIAAAGADGSMLATATAAAASTNAVTWGVFPCKEIVTPTIIEEVSFRAWSEEAFGIWREWASVYAQESPSGKLLRDTREDYWLVNIIHHDFVEADALWEMLGAA